MAKKAEVTYECYHCGEPVTEVDLVMKSFPIHTVVKDKDGKNVYNPLITRNLHYFCAHDLAVKMQMQDEINKEEEDFRKCYAKFCEWFNVERSLDQFTIHRLRGMRVGAFTAKGKNTRSVKKGHSYETILITMTYVEDTVMRAINTLDFTDARHRTNYVMKIIEGSLTLVQGRMNAKSRHDKYVDNIEIPVTNTPKAAYVSKRDTDLEAVNKVINKQKVEDKIDFEDLF